MRNCLRLLLVIGCLAGLAGTSDASPLIDFSTGPVGSLGTHTTTIGGVQLDAVGGALYRWSGEHCCEHVDQGLGILGPHERINPAEPELNRGEFLRLLRPDGTRWAGIWFSSVNGDASAAVYAGIYPVGVPLTVSADGASSAHTFYLPITGGSETASALWIVPKAGYLLAWGVDVRSEVQPAEPVPEPATLTLLGLGCGALARWRRQVRHD